MPLWDRSERRRRRLLPTHRPAFSKRRKFVLVAIFLSLALLVLQRLTVEDRYFAIIGLSGLSYGLTAWALWRDLRGPAWIVNMILPTLYPTAVGLFYFLLPQAAMTQMVIMLFFAASMYGLLLTTNIFAVASIRTIQLLRAARAVGFLLAILTSALLYHVIFSLRIPGYLVTALVLTVSYPLVLQNVWVYTMSDRLGRELLYALIGAVMIAEFAAALSFWLIDPPLASVMLAMVMYVVAGLFQHEMEGRMFSRTIQEFIWFAGIVFTVITAAILARWSG